MMAFWKEPPQPPADASNSLGPGMKFPSMQSDPVCTAAGREGASAHAAKRRRLEDTDARQEGCSKIAVCRSMSNVGQAANAGSDCVGPIGVADCDDSSHKTHDRENHDAAGNGRCSGTADRSWVHGGAAIGGNARCAWLLDHQHAVTCGRSARQPASVAPVWCAVQEPVHRYDKKPSLVTCSDRTDSSGQAHAANGCSQLTCTLPAQTHRHDENILRHKVGELSDDVRKQLAAARLPLPRLNFLLRSELDICQQYDPACQDPALVRASS